MRKGVEIVIAKIDNLFDIASINMCTIAQDYLNFSKLCHSRHYDKLQVCLYFEINGDILLFIELLQYVRAIEHLTTTLFQFVLQALSILRVVC